MKLLRYIVAFTTKMEGLKFLTRTKIIWKVAKLWCLLVHLEEEMIFYNQLGCQRHLLGRWACEPSLSSLQASFPDSWHIYLFRFAMSHFGMKSPLQFRKQKGTRLVMMALLGNGVLLLYGIFLSLISDWMVKFRRYCSCALSWRAYLISPFTHDLIINYHFSCRF